jgi:hypothetical protein
MSSFKLINNTDSILPLSDGSSILPRGVRVVDQLTLEMRRLERSRLLTIIQIPSVSGDDLLPDYVGTSDPNADNNGGSNDLESLTPAPDGSIPEFATGDNQWHATQAPRQLLLDGGNF